MSHILSLQIPDQMVEQLDRFALRLGNGMARTKAGIMLLDESLREAEFSLVEYRDSPIGRQPYMKGSGLAIWEVIMIAQQFGMDAERIAQDYKYPVEQIEAVFHFYEAYREEIDQAIEDNQIGYEAMQRLLPTIRLFEVPKEVIEAETSP